VADKEERDGAAVRVPPPLLFLVAIVLAVGLGWVWPRDPWFGGMLRWILAAGSLVGGIYLTASALGVFRRMGQDPKPWLPTPAITTEGPYGVTRNPMYLGLVMLVVGIGHLVGNGWFSITAVLAAIAVQKTAIEPEEAYLERKFGEDYLAYKRKVRRWV
jgi:protein-S-isoprenylcysteine O-methyltransferase Ste14